MKPWLQDADLTLYHGDVLQVLRELPAESVDCCVTSPPYWGLRDYGTGAWDGGDEGCDHASEQPQARPELPPSLQDREERFQSGGPLFTKPRANPQPSTCGKCGATRIDQQLGLEPTPEEYVTRMVEVFGEVRRVLAAHGTVFLNLGDSYAANRSYQVSDNKHKAHDFAESNALAVPPGLKPKDLVGIPWRVAFALQADGWYLRSDIIWAKPNPMPESVTDRPTKAHEMVFLLAKGPWIGREPGPIEKRLSREDARWLALLVDAEGNICVKRVAPQGDNSPQYGAQIAIGSTSRELLERAQALVGAGSVNERKGTNAPMFYWQVSNKVAQDLLYAIYPHLIVKPRQAQIAIHLESLLYHRGNATKRTERENAALESLWLRNKECNQFGSPDLLDVPAPKYGKWGAARYFFDQEAVREPSPAREENLRKIELGARGKGANGDRGDAGTGNFASPVSGRNIRSVWEIATQPYPEAHFATFPEELARRCIAAGTSERGKCPECGAPWVRIVETNNPSKHAADDKTLGWANTHSKTSNAQSSKSLHRNPGGVYSSAVVKGWEQGCNCGRASDPDLGANGQDSAYLSHIVEKSVPCTVLDPFVGSGTVAHVARKLGRHAVGIDLNESYLQLAARRLQQQSLFASEVAS